eukprot:17557-Chlamydomonas_euryale.AAC.1
MASSAGSSIAGLFSGQPFTDKSSVQQLEDANPDLDTVQEMKGGGHSSQCTMVKHQRQFCVDLVLWFWGKSSANLSIKRPELSGTGKKSSGVGEMLSLPRNS